MKSANQTAATLTDASVVNRTVTVLRGAQTMKDKVALAQAVVR
jgi:hypothetical protein